MLNQVKTISALVFYVSRNKAVIDRERAAVVSGSVGVVSLHPLMMALLPKFGYSNKWANNLVPFNDNERLQAQVSILNLLGSADSASASSTGIPLPSTMYTKQADSIVQDIVRNVLAYAQSTSEISSSNDPLSFWPSPSRARWAMLACLTLRPHWQPWQRSFVSTLIGLISIRHAFQKHPKPWLTLNSLASLSTSGL